MSVNVTDFPTIGPFYQPSLKRNKAIKARSRGRLSANSKAAQFHNVKCDQDDESVRQAFGYGENKLTKLQREKSDEPYVTEVCLGPPNSTTHTTDDEQNDSMQHAWLQYLDERGDVFYMNLARPYINNCGENFLLNDIEQRPSSRTHSDVLWEQSPPSDVGHKVKDVYLSAAPMQTTSEGDVVDLCEALFGIVLCRYGDKQREPHRTRVKDRLVIVQSVTRGSDADRCQQVHRGDMLLKIDDENVSWNNLETILARITKPKMVKINLQPPLVIGSTNDTKNASTSGSPLPHSLQTSLLGAAGPAASLAFVSQPHVALYLTLESTRDSLSDQDDVIYQFPDNPSRLTDLRGAFLTLSNLLTDISNNSAKISTVRWDSHIMHVGYHAEGRDAFIVALSSKHVTKNFMHHIVQDLVRILKTSYGSISSAFRNPANLAQLNQLFALTFHSVLQTHDLCIPGLSLSADTNAIMFLESVLACHALNMPDEYKVYCDSLLSDFEAADFTDNDEEILEMRRTYSVLGTALFYKGQLVCSHLTTDDLFDMYLYMKYLCVLSVTRQHGVNECVFWHETYPTRRSCHDSVVFGYSEPDARYFTLIVAQKHTLMGVLLEAGGCAAWADGHPAPSPFYVDRIKALISEIDIAGLTVCFDKILTGMSAGPSLVGADRFIALPGRTREDAPPSPTKLMSPKLKSTPVRQALDPNHSQFWQPSPKSEKRRLTIGVSSSCTEGIDCAEADLDSSPGDPTTPVVYRKHGRRHSIDSYESFDSGASNNVNSATKMNWYSSLFDLNNINRGLCPNDDASPLPYNRRVTRGPSNVLFHYVTLDTHAGVYVCPSMHEVAAVSGAIHSQVLSNFQRCCHILESRFDHAHLQVKQDNSSRFACFLDSIKYLEQAVLFQFTPSTWSDSKKTPPVLSYWVIARQLLDAEHLMFVCVHDSAPQNMIELGFFLCRSQSV